jgi:hypothetical protein
MTVSRIGAWVRISAQKELVIFMVEAFQLKAKAVHLLSLKKRHFQKATSLRLLKGNF